MSENLPENETSVIIMEPRGKNLPNVTLQKVRFYGRPNFGGEMDRFKDPRPKCTVIIPDNAVEPLRELGYNVKTTVPDPEDFELGREPVNHLKVMVDAKSDIYIVLNGESEKLAEEKRGIIDRSRFEEMDMEIRAWMYNKDEVDQGLEEPKYSARLVTFVGVMRPSILGAKYGLL